MPILPWLWVKSSLGHTSATIPMVHRSGETEEAFLVDFAVAMDGG